MKEEAARATREKADAEMQRLQQLEREMQETQEQAANEAKKAKEKGRGEWLSNAPYKPHDSSSSPSY